MEVRVSSTTESPSRVEADAVVIGLHAGQGLSRPAADVDQVTGGVLSRLIECQEIRGKPCELVALLEPRGVAARQVLAVGLGDPAALDRGVVYRAAAAAARQLAARQRSRVVFYLGDPRDAALAESGICGALTGCHGQDLYRTEKKRFPIEEIVWAEADAEVCRSGRILGGAVNLARQLVNEPPTEIYPDSFARRAVVVAQSCALECEVWDEARLERERCGALLAVGRGSDRGPRLVILRYRGAAASQAPLALVGKGVTFDSGGLSLKPSESMLTMKCDMAGAATVLATLQAIAQLQLPVNVVGLIGLVENMPGSRAYKLGDVLTARNGRTIEVHNTDAEGRLVLADVLCVALAQEPRPERIIDLATLTGACVVALGQDVAGLMTNSQPWCDTVAAAARACGERVWQLPMFPEYDEQIQGEVADIKNVGEGRWGGAITAAKFLEQFVESTPWAHLDIAGPAFLEKPKPWQDGGGSGVLVRTLVEVARSEWAAVHP